MQWLGIDVGGTFTDLVLYDEAGGTLVVDKVPSTSADPSLGILAGIARLGVNLSGVAKLVHGTTLATNTILERKGARTAVLTTSGFRDVLEVGRGNRTILWTEGSNPSPSVRESVSRETFAAAVGDPYLLHEKVLFLSRPQFSCVILKGCTLADCTQRRPPIRSRA
jgi:N-methylhydantoinase A/oxoprolinase/acetone carboxylase beta subunit